jgi:hypothetical protein
MVDSSDGLGDGIRTNRTRVTCKWHRVLHYCHVEPQASLGCIGSITFTHPFSIDRGAPSLRGWDLWLLLKTKDARTWPQPIDRPEDPVSANISTGFNWAHHDAVTAWSKAGRKGPKQHGKFDRTPRLKETACHPEREGPAVSARSDRVRSHAETGSCCVLPWRLPCEITGSHR